MFTFNTENGICRNDRDPDFITQGYSGIGDGLLNPSKQNVRNLGPIPHWMYKIVPVDFTPLVDNSKASLTIQELEYLKGLKRLGPKIFRLDPTVYEQYKVTFNRSGFFIHWDTVNHKMIASDGCIVFYWEWVFDYIYTENLKGNNILQVI